ncbi:MAG: hypothetical protein GF308_17970 [Candidatus Heimdallarchaeota archaeon]|nr:hypothetical protein [Candidatus Heimdallarchaeota archaeon]
MAKYFRKSDSIDYALTQWFDDIVAKQNRYPKILNEVVNKCQNDVLEKAVKLQKYQGELRTKEILKQKGSLVKNAKEIEPKLNELIEFLYNYKTLVEEIDGFEFNLKTPQRLLDLLKKDIETLEKLEISLKDLVKAANINFKDNNGKPNKDLEQQYEEHVKKYKGLLEKISNDYQIIDNEFSELLTELENEVDKAKKLKKEKVA